MKTIQEIRDKAARDIARIEHEIAICGILPEVDRAPTICPQRDSVWLSYKANTWDDVLTTFDAYDSAPAYVVRRKPYAPCVRGEYEESDTSETLVSDTYAWVEFNHSIRLSPTAIFAMLATLSDGSLARIRVTLESAHWNAGPWHRDLATRFSCDNPRRREENRTYHADGPAFLAQCDFTWSAATGERNGSALWVSGCFMTRDCLAAALDTLR